MHLSLSVEAEGSRAEHTVIKNCAPKSIYEFTLPLSKYQIYSLDIVQKLLVLIYFLSSKSVQENPKINLNVVGKQ